jgi:hypothetical protein
MMTAPDGTIVPPAEQRPKFSVHLSLPGASAGRGDGTTASFPGPTSGELFNLNTTDGDLTVTILAHNDDGSINTGFTHTVGLSVTPAFDATALGNDASGGGPWQPWSGQALSNAPVRLADIVNGAASLPKALRMSGLAFHAMGAQAPTLHFIIGVTTLDASNKAVRTEGALYFTARPDTGCAGLSFDSFYFWPLSKDGTLTIKAGAPQSEHLLVAALTRQAGLGPSRCLLIPKPTDTFKIAFASMNALSFGKYLMALPTVALVVPEWLLQESVYTFNHSGASGGERVLFDVIKPASPPGGVLDTSGLFGLRIFELSSPLTTVSSVRLDIVQR